MPHLKCIAVPSHCLLLTCIRASKRALFAIMLMDQRMAPLACFAMRLDVQVRCAGNHEMNHVFSSRFLDETGYKLYIMYSMPFNFDYYYNYVAVGISKRGWGEVNSIYNSMYYEDDSGTSWFKRVTGGDRATVTWGKYSATGM